jgi:GT2 family glycosyltransferase
MKLSIIITSWNTEKLLHACLHSIKSFLPSVLCEIIVVDNASKDASVAMVEQEFPEVKLIKSKKNSGYAGGNNLGFSYSAGEYILLLGSDTEVFSGTIQTMIDFLDEQRDVGLVSCRLELPNGELQHSCKKFPTVANAIAMYCSLHSLNKKYLMFAFDHTSIKEIDQPDATCVMIRRSVLGDQIFNEHFSILYNDVDLCQRIKRKGWKIVFIPSAKVIHHGSQSTKQASPNVRLVMYQNILLYYQTYFGVYARIVLAPILAIRHCIATQSFSGLKLLFSIKSAELT